MNNKTKNIIAKQITLLNNFNSVSKELNLLDYDFIDTELEIKELNKLGINHLSSYRIKQSKKRKLLLRKMNKELKTMGF